ncbi:hypothetical protein QTH97_18865 [Variovorax sp. J22R24]|uniref:hypothetical protein n=1 Tax=Variovorax gracilis TaxID=3053502 RepID=UPI00257556AB|nr:hypothetical protein [Variovorax sp. J22R24]MDM0107015.1 hypothetical protein [Variovorax sp. J22R24]
MHFQCRPVDASFFDTAPLQFKNVADLDASPSKVFAIFEDGESWPHWFSLGGPLSKMYFESMFESACKNLKTYVKQ